MTKHRFALCAFLFLATGSICTLPDLARCQATISFTSDGTWEAHAMDADGSQGQLLGQAIAPAWAFHPHMDSSAIPGALWVWFPTDPLAAADLKGAYFSKQFSLPGTPRGGHIAVAVDDFAEVIVNGVAVGSMGSITDIGLAAEAQRDLRKFDLLPYLMPGTNTIAVRAQNGPAWFSGGDCDPCNYYANVAGVIFGGNLSYDMPTAAQRVAWGSLKMKYR